MSHNNSNFNNNPLNFNHFSNNNTNFEQQLFSNHQNDNIPINPNPGQQNQNPQASQQQPNTGRVQVDPNNRTDFDRVATGFLSRGNRSLKATVHYLKANKNVHMGSAEEVTFQDIALLAGGHVKYVKTTQCATQEYTQQKDVTTKKGMKEYALSHEVIRDQVPYRFVQDQDLQERRKVYVDQNIGWWAGLISALDHKGFTQHIKNKQDESVNAQLHPSEKQVGSWYTTKDELHEVKECTKSARVSSNIANKLDIMSLMEKDGSFKEMQMKAQVSGLDGFGRYLKSKQRQEKNGFVTVNGAEMTEINGSIVNNIQSKAIQKLRVKEKMLTQMMNNSEKNKQKLVISLMSLGVTNLAGWNFDLMTAYHFDKIFKGVQKSIDMISNLAQNDKTKQVVKKMMVLLITRFFTER